MRPVLALLLALLGQTASSADELDTNESATITRSDPGDATAVGPRYAPVTIEFFCSYVNAPCAAAHEQLRELSRKHPQRLRVVYRQYILPWHDNDALALAGIEAWHENRFAAWLDAVYSLQGAATLRDLDYLIEQAQLDGAAVKAAIAHRTGAELLDADHRRHQSLTAQSIPALVWNGMQLPFPRTPELLSVMFARTYDSARALLDDGVALRDLLPTIERQDKTPPVDPSIADAPRITIHTDHSPARGDANAPVTIVVFDDFDCIPCRRLDATLDGLVPAYGTQVRQVHKYLVNHHSPTSRFSSEVAACAENEGRFWPLHDALVSMARVDETTVQRVALAVGLDDRRLTENLSTHACAGPVDADAAEAQALGIDTAPAVFVDGLPVTGSTTAQLRAIIDAELAPGMLEDLTNPK